MINSLPKRDSESLWHPYTQHLIADAPLAIESASGAYLRDEGGKSYLDMISSWWVNLHGHGCQELASAIAVQARKLDHVHFAGITHEPAVELAEKLLRLANLGAGSRLFYSDNGSTAVEVALKICHQYWQNRGQKRNGVLAFRGGYHGDTVGAMAVGATSGFFNAFHSWMFDVETINLPYTWDGASTEADESQCIQRLSATVQEKGEGIAALIVEPLVQGSAGMRFHTSAILSQVCKIAKSAGIPVIFDEVMTGFFRTGSLFAYMQTDVIPDLVCLSKGLTGGILPLGATLVRWEYFEAFLGNSFSTALAHGHSFTGNPISCAAALASLDLLEKRNAGESVRRISMALSKKLHELAQSHPIEKTRVLGGIAAFEIRGKSGDYSDQAGKPLARFAQKHGVILRPLGNVVYVMPPYCVNIEDLDLAFGVINDFFFHHAFE